MATVEEVRKLAQVVCWLAKEFVGRLFYFKSLGEDDLQVIFDKLRKIDNLFIELHRFLVLRIK
jgi:hypothetical protein